MNTAKDVIKAKCEQYWNEHNICDAEVHAILEFIHREASKLNDDGENEGARPEEGYHGPPAFTFQQWSIGKHMMGGIERYLCDFIPPGSFLTAIICNNLKEAVGGADDENLRNLPAFAAFFYNHAPSISWGSKDDMIVYTKAVVWHGGDLEKECLSSNDAWRWLENEIVGQPYSLKEAIKDHDWRVEMKYQHIADAVRKDWRW